MFRQIKIALLFLFLLAGAALVYAQSGYQVVTVSNPGTISGVVKWSGPQPAALMLPINKDPEVCDPESHKKRDLERLIIGPDGGVANTVVFLKNITSGKAMDLPEARRFLDQKRCEYVPHSCWYRRTERCKWRVPIRCCILSTWTVQLPLICHFLSRIE